MHYLLFYEKGQNFEAKQGPSRAPHLAYVQAAVKRGELVLAGSLLDPNDGAAVLLFKADSPAVAEAFAKSDPYVTHGIVSKWKVRTWDTVVGKEAANPLPE